MRASVDVSNLVVRCGDSSSPFQFDLTEGLASIELDGRAYEVRPLTWRAMLRLARFAPLTETFIEARLLEACTGHPKNSFGGERNEAKLLALSIWVNRSSDETYGLPLDQAKLAGVIAELCRSLGVGPMALAELTVPEVETLWQTVDHKPVEKTSNGRDMPQATGPASVVREQFDTKIMIVPDETEQVEVLSVNGAEQESSPELMVHREEDLTTEEVPAVEKPIRSLTSNVTAPVRRPGARFRVSLNSSIGKTEKAGTVLRVPVSQPRVPAFSPAEDIYPIEAPRADRAAEPINFQISPTFEPPAASVSTSRIQADVAVITPEALSWSRSGEFSEAGSFAENEAAVVMLDLFCERLAEAAADLGVMEEV